MVIAMIEMVAVVAVVVVVVQFLVTNAVHMQERSSLGH
jgi:hypothetical protein